MHKLNIETSQNVEISYPTASLVERIFAYLIDYTIIMAYIIIVVFILDGISDYDDYIKIALVFILPVYLFYHLAFEYFNNGQSPGKKVFNLKVMQLDGSKPTLGNYFTRWILGLFEFTLFLGAPAVFAILFTKKSQRIGDIAGSTAVVKNKALSMGKHIVDKQFSSNYSPQFPKAKFLNDQQAEVINSVLTNPVNHLRNKQIVVLADKIKDSFGIVDEQDLKPKKFLTQLLDDYAFFYWEEENRGQIFELQQDISKVLG